MTAPITTPHVLVSGAGIAGTALALQLIRSGIRTTVIERAAAPRPGGQAVDLRGPSREAAERMGLMPGITRHQLHEEGLIYVDAHGRGYGRMAMADFDGQGAVAEIEITRGDLVEVIAEVLAEASAQAVDEAGEPLLDLRYDDAIASLSQDEHGVDVSLTSGRTGRFDLVVGADGVHSATRRLAFGPEERYATPLGGYGAFFTMPSPADLEPDWFSMRLVPGAMLGIRPDADPATSKAILTVRGPHDPSLRRDRAAQQEVVRQAIQGAGWHAAAVLAAMEEADDFYFDELVRVDVPDLAAGRVTLVGDAGYSGSPLTGMGTAMALVGAYVLAAELAATPGDPTGAIARYGAAIAPFLEQAKKIPGGSLSTMLPRTKLLSALSKVNVKVMLSRPLRPIMKRMFLAGQGAELELPTTRRAEPVEAR
ncbi:FAD-dependent monooxygenase [Agromyces larvae]|uniref:FAD-dependent monooxygenase n=1 Tax=Agromyces larvae TaxID=2929802 RepID=A0ABY4C487_9MICO|nr:FAD-dependent monooxygenase [Agromyces larvae]UOE43585.1 FAD-dependent monooxygenase [Agromyces larvae]